MDAAFRSRTGRLMWHRHCSDPGSTEPDESATMPHALINAVQRTAAGLAILAAMAASPTTPAQAGEVVIKDCLHGSGERYDSGYRTGYGETYSNDHGYQHGSRYSYTRPHNGGFRRGFGGRFHRDIAIGSSNQNGGGSINRADAGSNNGSRDGYATGYEAGSRGVHGLDSCVEVHRELGNAYVIHVPPPRPEDAREAENHERLWRARCRPAIKQDRYGMNRYVYAAPGCEFGKYE